MAWDAARYLRFGEVRRRPAADQIGRIPLDPAGLVVGCGPGSVTRLLHERWPQAGVSGVEASPATLARAPELLPAVRSTAADLAAAWPCRADGSTPFPFRRLFVAARC